MSSRRNFLDADNSIMERNLRFVKNDFEENLNQYFGGSAGRGNNSTNVSPPPRDYKVVQPKPDICVSTKFNKGKTHGWNSNELDVRKGFLRKLGLARHEAYELAKNTTFDMNYVEQMYSDLVAKGFHQNEIKNRILYEIRDFSNDINTQKELDISTFRHSENRSRSRSRSRLYSSSRNDHREGRCQRKRSISPNRNSITFHEERNEEYSSRQLNIHDIEGDGTNREQSFFRPYSPTAAARRSERTQLSSSRSPRELNLLQERWGGEYLLQHDNFRDETGSNKSFRSCSLERIDRRGDFYHSPRSHSPTEVPNERNFVDEMRNRHFGQRPFSPPKNIHSEESFHLSISRSTNREFNFLQNTNFRDDLIHNRSRSNSPTEFDHRERRQFSRKSSSDKRFSLKGEENGSAPSFKYEIMRDSDRQRHRSRSYSPLRIRSPSPYRGAIAKRQRRSRGYSPLGNDRRMESFKSSRVNSPSRNWSSRSDSDRDKERRNDFLQNMTRQNTNYRDKSRTTSNFNTDRHQGSDQDRSIPSLLMMDVFSNETQNSSISSRDRNIPSLLSLSLDPMQNDQNIQNSWNNQERRDRKNRQNFDRTARTLAMEANEIKDILKTPIIPSGLTKPLPGHLKANPRDYWSKWWPQYKYIEYSIPKCNTNDFEVKQCINFLFTPDTIEYSKHCQMLLTDGIKEVMETQDISETNYSARNVYKLFQYKKHLEDSNFQNALTPLQLSCLAPALRQLQIKPKLALMHQALIVKFHHTVEILKHKHAVRPSTLNASQVLLNKKSFQYLVMESIQELKKMCQQDWFDFNEFYKSIKAKKVDIFSLCMDQHNKYNE